MKLQLYDNTAANRVTDYGVDFVAVNGVRHTENILLNAQRMLPGWAAAGFDALRAADIEAILTFNPGVVLIGTGSTQRFPPASLLRPLIDARVGFEIMTLPAACRTYNVLVEDGRAVTAALMLG